MADPARRSPPPAPAPDDRPGRVVGTPFRRVDGRAKVTGRTLFADDLEFPRMAYLRLVRSTAPHARIVRIDAAAARAMDGVLAVLTGADFPEPFGIMPVSQDEHALCPDKVRFVGDPVAAVVATTEDIAIAAARTVVLEYEALPTIATIEEALAPVDGDARIHDRGDGGNVHKKVSLRFGDVEPGFAGAALLLDQVYFYQGSTHLPLEQHAAVAVPEDDDRLTLYSSTQTPHYLHRALAQVLKLPAARIRVVATPCGGGFGGKSDPFNHEIVAAKAALVVGRPVKVTLTREEVFYCHRGRHPVLMHLKTAFDADGAMRAQHLRTALDGGAYGSYGVASTYYTGALQTTTYRLDAYHFDGVRVFTNKPPCGPKRGHGTPQPRFALEVQLDQAAVSLGLDPVEIRTRNLAPAGTITANWLKLGTNELGRCIDAVVAGSAFRERWGKLPQGHGVGLACGAYLCGAGLPIYWNHLPQSAVALRLDRSGLVTVSCGESEIGQGSDSVLAAVVADVLGLPLADVRLSVADTDLTPVDLGSYSSRVTLMVGQAAMEAAEKARAILAEAAAAKLGIAADRVVFAEGRVYDAADPDRGISFVDAVWEAEARHGLIATTGSYLPPRAPGRYRGAGVGPSPTYSYTAAVIEVKVDPATGLIDVEQVWIAHDVGRAINPVLTLGQVEGSVYMGLGEALYEEQVVRRLPRHRSNASLLRAVSMLDYKSPTFGDMPPVTTYLIEEPDPAGPFGAKEVGQGPLLPIAPALANAVYDAVGVRVDEVPILPHKILGALDAARRGEAPRFGPTRFPDTDYGEALIVPTPAEGGDGTAINDWKDRQRRGMRGSGGTMAERPAAPTGKS